MPRHFIRKKKLALELKILMSDDNEISFRFYVTWHNINK